MSTRLSQDLSSYALGVGEQTNQNHQNCPAGLDTKKRLYIKRTNDGYQWYCHHCAQGGFVRGGIRNIHRVEEPYEGPSLPADFDPDWNNWPKWAEEFQVKGWGYSKYMDRVVIPVYGPDLKGYQARAAPNKKPKYLTKGKRLVYKVCKGRDDVCIVEDALSAERVGKVIDTAACLGSDMNTETLMQVARGHKRAFVWLDNDNPTVRKNQRSLIQRLRLVLPTAGIITERDPKHYTTEEIEECLKAARFTNA